MPATTTATPPDRLLELQALLATDRARMCILDIVAGLGLPDCWVAAGFVRNAVWDHLHGYPASPPPGDIDVIWHDRNAIDPALDRRLEARLRARDASLDWSVKNQARMHLRNDDAPYASATDAMRHWPETATAVGVRLSPRGAIEVAAPFGLDDLFSLVVRPTPRFMGDKHAMYRKRVVDKAWPGSWPGLHVEDTSA
jgi:hypothetical protein